jgi:hypothetical protein
MNSLRLTIDAEGKRPVRLLILGIFIHIHSYAPPAGGKREITHAPPSRLVHLFWRIG